MDETVIVICPQCHAKNRVPRTKLGQEAKCGKCDFHFTASEPILSAPITVTDATFSHDVLESSLPVVVDFWAPWCGPCRMVAPLLEELAGDYAGRLKIAKLNTDENQQTAAIYQVQGIPTLLFMKDGQVVDSVVGALPKSTLHERIKQIV